MVAVVREAVERRRGCRLRRRCCAANPPLGPWCVRGRGLRERQCPAGSAVVGRSRLLAGGAKEEEKREADAAVRGPGGEREGTAGKGTTGWANGEPDTQLLVATAARTRRRPCRLPVASVEERGETGTGRFRSSDPGCGAVVVKGPLCSAATLASPGNAPAGVMRATRRLSQGSSSPGEFGSESSYPALHFKAPVERRNRNCRRPRVALR